MQTHDREADHSQPITRWTCKIRDPALEQRFLEQQYPKKRRLLRITAWMIVALVASSIAVDALNMSGDNLGWLPVVLALRAATVVVPLVVALGAKHIETAKGFDAVSLLMWVAAIVPFTMIASIYGRLIGQTNSIGIFLIVLLAISVLSVGRQRITAWTAGIVFFLGIVSQLGAYGLDITRIVLATVMLGAALLPGLLFANVRRRQARDSWLAHLALQHANDALRAEVDHRAEVETELEALRRAESEAARERWRSLIENAQDYIAIVNEDCSVRSVNREDAELAQLGTAGKPLGHGLGAVDGARVYAVLKHVMTSGTADQLEISTHDGSRHLLVRLGPIMHGDRASGAIMLASDITERRRLQGQLAQSQKLQAVGTLAGGIAHDFNNILTAILGASELGADREDLPVETRDYFQEINEAAKRGAALTRQLLVFSRGEPLTVQVVDLAEILPRTLRMIERLLGEGVLLRESVTEARCWVSADPTQLEQVVLNLCMNAKDAMPTGGRLLVKLERVRRYDDEHVVLTVSDEGTGMDASTLASAFDPFFTTKATGQGTGLGLSVVLGIIEQSGGTIEADSEVGRGTRFTIRLPLAAAPASAAHVTLVPTPDLAGTVLVVEDQPMLRRIIAEHLRRAGFQVHEAATRSEAEQVAVQFPELDLLVSDVVMPDHTGPEVAARVRQHVPGLPVLFISGFSGEILDQLGIRELDAAFLAKPFSGVQLVAAVASSLGR